MPNQIYLLRHPETVWNLQGRFQGVEEGAITQRGKNETEIFVKNLNLYKVDRIYYANNKRTKYVAKKIKKKYKNALLLVDTRLAERSFGENEGKLYSEVYLDDDITTDYEARFRRKHPMGESHEEVFYRVKSFMQSMIYSLNGNETVICVTSGSVIRIILKIKNNLSLKEMYDLDIPNLFFVKL